MKRRPPRACYPPARRRTRTIEATTTTMITMMMIMTMMTLDVRGVVGRSVGRGNAR